MIDESTICTLAADEFDKRMELEALARMNIAGLTYDERKKQAIEYATAKARHQEAEHLLHLAIKGAVKKEIKV